MFSEIKVACPRSTKEKMVDFETQSGTKACVSSLYLSFSTLYRYSIYFFPFNTNQA